MVDKPKSTAPTSEVATKQATADTVKAEKAARESDVPVARRKPDSGISAPSDHLDLGIEVIEKANLRGSSSGHRTLADLRRGRNKQDGRKPILIVIAVAVIVLVLIMVAVGVWLLTMMATPSTSPPVDDNKPRDTSCRYVESMYL